MLLERTVVVIRSFNNSGVVEVVSRYLDIQKIKLVIVVVNATPDKGATRAWLSGIQDTRLVILEMFEGYSWTSALNRALMAVRMKNLEFHGFEFIFNTSIEAHFSEEQLLGMLQSFRDNQVGIVGTTFDGRLDGNAVETGRSYRHPRNTGMVIRLQSFNSGFGMFDAFCDDAGGMEDIDFVLATLILSPFEYRMLDLRVLLLLGKNYNQDQKEQREQQAMGKIIARWRDLFPVGASERLRIDDAITRMGIEE